MVIPVVQPHKVTSPYGWRYLNEEREFHKGIDLISEKGIRDVISAFDGIVTYDQDDYKEIFRWTEKHHSAGNMVIVRHELPSGLYYIRYIHLINNIVCKGQKVFEGAKLGVYADVGKSYGPHLHVDAYDMNWRPVNITLLFNQGGLLL